MMILYALALAFVAAMGGFHYAEGNEAWGIANFIISALLTIGLALDDEPS